MVLRAQSLLLLFLCQPASLSPLRPPSTTSLSSKIFCGTHESLEDEEPRRFKRYVFGELGRLQGNVIRYRVSRYPRWELHKTMSRRSLKSYVDTALRKAIKMWEKPIDVSFVEWPMRGADIEVSFATHYHGDPYPFDGSGTEIAHAFYPNHRKRRGQIHIDDHEPWGPRGRNLNWVLAHELGHVLGLPHSQQESIMKVHYHGFEQSEPYLFPDDIMNIQKLYGKRTDFDEVESLHSEETTTEPNNALCNGEPYDTIFTLPNGTLYVFRGKEFWSVDAQENITVTGPLPIAEHWGNIETPVDAAFSDHFDWTWIIKGDSAWRVDASSDKLRLFPKESLREVPPFSNYIYNSVDAVLSVNTDSDDQSTFLFLGTKYWFDANSDGETDEGYYRQIKEIDKRIKSVDAAISLPGGNYIFSGDSYWKVRTERNSLKAEKGYPQSTSKDWFHCR